MASKGVGDVLEKDQAQHDVFVLSSINVTAECIGGLPQGGLKADGGAVFGFG
jgi:hypothetical protein